MRNFFLSLKQFVKLFKIQYNNKKHSNFKRHPVEFILKILIYFILLFGLTIGLYYLLHFFQENSFFGILVFPIYFFDFLFITAFLVITFSALYRVFNELYLSSDNQLLITFPVSKTQLFFSKILICYILDFARNFLLLFVLFISYSYLNNFVVEHYFWTIFLIPIMIFVPYIFVSIFTIPIFYIREFFKRNILIKNLVITIFALGVFAGLFILFLQIPEEIRIEERWETVILPKLKDFVLLYEKIFYPFTILSMIALGFESSLSSPYRLPTTTNKTITLFAFMLLFIVICILINYFFVRKFFFNTIFKSFEITKIRNDLIYKNKTASFLSKEIKICDKLGHSLKINVLKDMLSIAYDNNLDFYRNNNYVIDDYLSILKSLFKEYTFEIVDKSSIGGNFMIFQNKKSNHLVLCEHKDEKNVYCYDPYQFASKNKKLPTTLSFIKKNVIRDFKDSGVLFYHLSVILLPSIIIFGLNRVFAGLNLTVQGAKLVFIFLFCLELLFVLFLSINASSIFSKHQKNAYILNVAPISKSTSVFVELLNMFIVGIVSITLMTFNYFISTPLQGINGLLVYLTLIVVFVICIIVNAFIDLSSLKNHLFVANTSEKAGEQNELVSFLFAIVFFGILASMCALLVMFTKLQTSLVLFAFSLCVLLILLFIISLKGYLRVKKRGRV